MFVEVDERTHHPGFPECRIGHPDHWHPAEGPQREIIGAWIVRHNREKKLDHRNIEWSLIRRYGEDWREEAEIL